MRQGLWDGLNPAELAACVSALSFESRQPDDAHPPRLPKGRVPEALSAMVRTWGELDQLEKDNDLSFLRAPDLGFAWAAYRWARGASLESVLEGSPDLTPGNFVRSVKQLIDLLDQIAKAASRAPAPQPPAPASSDPPTPPTPPTPSQLRAPRPAACPRPLVPRSTPCAAAWSPTPPSPTKRLHGSLSLPYLNSGRVALPSRLPSPSLSPPLALPLASPSPSRSLPPRVPLASCPPAPRSLSATARAPLDAMRRGVLAYSAVAD